MTHFLKSEREREKLRERKSGSSHSVMERCGGWLTTRCTGCLELHGNREREGLKEAEVQGLHLFQQHFNYFGRWRLVKLMHSGAPATTGRNPQRLWRSIFLFFFLFNLSPLSRICEITATVGNTEGLRKQTDNERARQRWGEEVGEEKTRVQERQMRREMKQSERR